MVLPRDTSRDAWARLVAGLRAMTPQDRMALATTMSDEIRQLARDGLRSRHPDWSLAQLETAFDDLILGDSIARDRRAAIAK